MHILKKERHMHGNLYLDWLTHSVSQVVMLIVIEIQIIKSVVLAAYHDYSHRH